MKALTKLSLLEQAIGEIDPQVEPADVLYVAPAMAEARCENCINFVGPASCRIVKGEIHKAAWCELHDFDEVRAQLKAGAIPIGTDAK